MTHHVIARICMGAFQFPMPELAAERLEATDLIAFVIRPWTLDGGGVARPGVVCIAAGAGATAGLGFATGERWLNSAAIAAMSQADAKNSRLSPKGRFRFAPSSSQSPVAAFELSNAP